MNEADDPGNANLWSGALDVPGNANLPIGAFDVPGNANLPIGAFENAIQENGVPGGVPGGTWHSRGYLPHFESDVKTQSVTFHLADSMSRVVLQRFEQELKAVAPGRMDAERRKRMEAWIDAGHGSCVLREPEIGQMVEQALLFFDCQRYRLLAWVVMPNHVHTLFQPINGWSVAKILASWKKYTATHICAFRRMHGDVPPGNANLPIGSLKDAIQENGVPRKSATQENAVSPVWHREYWDRYIRDDYHFQQALEYIHNNPVKAGLAARPEDWPWSSARFNDANAGENANQEIGVPREET